MIDVRGQQEQGSRSPTEQHDRRNGEHEGERDHATAVLGVDRHGESLGEGGRCRQRNEADESTTAVDRRREDVAGRNQNAEARQAHGQDEGG